MIKKSAKHVFAESVTQNIMDLVEHTYYVSKEYSDESPRLSMSYDCDHHRLDVTLNDDQIDIPLKYNRLNRRVAIELLEDANASAKDAYPVNGSDRVFDQSTINTIQAICIKHIDYNRSSPKEEAFFTFDARTGKLQGVVQERQTERLQGNVPHYSNDYTAYTLVETRCNRYNHLSDDLRTDAIQTDISDQSARWNRSMDRHLMLVNDNPINQNEVRLRDCMTREDDDVLLSFDGLDEQIDEYEM